LPCAGSSESDLDNLAVRRWFAGKDRMMDATALESLGVLVRHGSGRVASNGGLILFGEEEARQRFFPDARISCARFRGIDKSEFLDRQDMDGLLDAVMAVSKFIARNTRLASRIEDMQREDLPEYPSVAIREVLVNAVAHADYATTGMRIFVSIFSDRLEIQSPGMFPFGMTMDDFKAGVSRIRNRVVCRVLHEVGLMEQWGSGYQRIVNSCSEGGYPEPEWQELGHCIRVTFRPHPSIAHGDRVNDRVNDRVSDTVFGAVTDTVSGLDLNERQRWIIEQLLAGIKIKAEDVVQKWSVGEATVRRDLAGLRNHGLIEFVGAPKTGHYRIKSSEAE
jgi:predicted HTH transcriptional regulator